MAPDLWCYQLLKDLNELCQVNMNQLSFQIQAEKREKIPLFYHDQLIVPL